MASSDNRGIMYIYDLPKNCQDLGDNVYTVLSNFKGISRIHIRQYTNYGRAELYPSKKGVSLSFHEWRYLSQVLKAVYRNHKSPCVNFDYMKDLPTSKDGITVNVHTESPGTFSFLISKKVTMNTGKVISNEIALTCNQSETLAFKCMPITGWFIEHILTIKINTQCIEPGTEDLIRENHKTVRELNKTFKSIFIDEMHQDLRNCMCADADELIDAMLQIDVIKVLNEVFKLYPNEVMFHDKITLQGYVKTMVDKFVLNDDVLNDDLEYF